MLAARAISGDFYNTFASAIYMYIVVASASFIHIYTINTNAKSRESVELLEISRAMNISLEKNKRRQSPGRSRWISTPACALINRSRRNNGREKAEKKREREEEKLYTFAPVIWSGQPDRCIR